MTVFCEGFAGVLTTAHRSPRVAFSYDFSYVINKLPTPRCFSFWRCPCFLGDPVLVWCSDLGSVHLSGNQNRRD